MLFKIEVLTGTYFCKAKAKSLELGTFYDQSFTKKPGEQSFSTKFKNMSTLIYMTVQKNTSPNIILEVIKLLCKKKKFYIQVNVMCRFGMKIRKNLEKGFQKRFRKLLETLLM